MFPRVGGAILALAAAALLALAAMLPWWDGHPDIDGKAMRLKSLDTALIAGAESCNTGGDGKCTPITMTSAFRIVARVEAGAIGGTAVALIAVAIATLARREGRKPLGGIARALGVLALVLGIVVFVLGPGIKANDHTLSVPLAAGFWLFVVGLIGALAVPGLTASAAVIARAAPRPRAPAPAPAPSGGAGGIDALIASLPAPAPMPVAKPAIAQAFDIQALIAEPTPAPAPPTAAQSPGGALPGPSGQLKPLYEHAHVAPPMPPPRAKPASLPPPPPRAKPSSLPPPPGMTPATTAPPPRPKLPSVPPPFGVLAKPSAQLATQPAIVPTTTPPKQSFVFARSEPASELSEHADTKERERNDEIEQMTMRDARIAQQQDARVEKETTTEAAPLPTEEHPVVATPGPATDKVPTAAPHEPTVDSTIQTAPAPDTGEPEGTPAPAPVAKIPLSTADASLPPPVSASGGVSSGPSPACPQCEAPMAWVEEHLRFYCKSCRMYF